MNPLKTDLEAIRKRARANILDGAVTEAYKADRTKVVAVLNEVLATEIVCTLRYKHHYYMAKGIHAKPVADEFLERGVIVTIRDAGPGPGRPPGDSVPTSDADGGRGWWICRRSVDNIDGRVDDDGYVVRLVVGG